MPVVSTESIYVCRKSFVRKIRVNADGIFRITLPEFVQERFDKKEVSGKTKEDALSRFSEVCKEFETSSTTTRKVILYHMQHTQGYNPVFSMFDQLSFAQGEGVVVAAGVFTEERTEANDEISYRYVLDKDSSKGLRYSSLTGSRVLNQPRELCVDWTQEIEDMFKDLTKSLNRIQFKIAEILDSEESLIGFASSGQKLLTSRENVSEDA